MAVIKPKPEKVVDWFLALLQRELIIPNLVTRVGDQFFVGAKDDTVTMRIPGLVAVGRDYDFRARTEDIEFDDIEGGEGVTLRLDTHSYSATELTDEHMTLDEVDFAQEVLAPQVAAVVNRFEAKTLAGFRGANVKHSITFDGADDPHLVALEAKRRMDSEKTAPAGGRIYLVGSDIAAQWLASDRLSRADSIGTDGANDAVRDATIGRLAGSPVVESSSLNPGEGYYFHKTGIVLGSVAPRIPRGAVQGARLAKNGFAVRWIQDYYANRLVDRSIVSSFLGVNDVRDERNPDGTLLTEADAVPDPDGAGPGTATPAVVRRNVRIVKLVGAAGGVFTG
jgi:hypothetical protein